MNMKSNENWGDRISSCIESCLKWEMMMIAKVGRRLLAWKRVLPPPTRR